MRNLRTILRLLFAIGLAVAAHVFLTYRCGVKRSLMRRTTLLGGEMSAVDFVMMSRSGEPLTVMARTGSWQLVQPFSGSVDEPRVMRLVDALRVTPIDDMLGGQELARQNRTLASFALNDPRLKILVRSGDESVTVSFGCLTPSAAGVYAAVEGVDAVFVMPSNILEAVDVPADWLRRRSLLRMSPEIVTSFDLRRSVGSLMRFVRHEDQWRMVEPRERAVDSEKIRELLGELSTATAERFVWPTGGTNEAVEASSALLATYGLDPDSSLSLTFKCVDGVDRRFAVGGEAEDGRVYALAQNGAAIVTVPAALKDLIARGEASAFADMRVFLSEPSQVKSVSISDGDARYALAVGSDGLWRLDAPVSAPADARTAKAFVARVLALRTADLRPDGVAVSVNTNRAVSKVSKAALLKDFRLEDLRSKEILRIDPLSVKRVSSGIGLRAGQMLTSVVYDRDRRVWNVENSRESGVVDQVAVAKLLNALDPLQAQQVVRLKVTADDLRRYGLETPRLTVAVDQASENAVRRNILVGDLAAEGGRYATVGSVDAVFLIDDETCRLLSQPLVQAQVAEEAVP